MKKIRRKITFWFYLLLAFMVGISTITYGITSKLEEKLLNIEKVDVFLENTLEVRRMEKDFLLYGDPDYLSRGTRYLEALTSQLSENEELFVKLSSPHETATIRTTLENYSQNFRRLSQQPTRDPGLASEVRAQGQEITMFSEGLVTLERKVIHRLVRLISNTLLLALSLLVILACAAAAFFSRGIVGNLKKIEGHAALIAKGNFVEATFSSPNLEVNSLIKAFNSMSRELKRRQQQLVRSEKLASLGTMLAGVAHELNNPLSNISSSTELLEEELVPPKNSLAHELIDQIHQETERAITIIQTLLSVARHENFHRGHYLLRPLLQEIILLLKGQIPKEVEIKMTVGEDLSLFADKQKIQQVFLNLLKNSLDALDGKGVIEIKAWHNQAGLKIVLRDDGPGIPSQLKDKIFDPFFTTKDTGQGSGLGLFIVHDIIVQHGGTISVEQPTDRGAVFTIILPGKEKS